MLNFENVHALYKKPVKKVKKAKPQMADVNPLRIDIILQEIKRNNGMRPKDLVETSGFSCSTVRNSIIFLLSKNKITRAFIGNAGANKIYSYSSTEAS